MSERWPVTTRAPEPPPALPLLEELPRVGEGYDPARVGDAFDAFHRHIARLDATLRSLETAEGFARQAADLRSELRAFRRARWEQDWATAYARPVLGARPRVPAALPRLAAEIAFLIAVAVVLGVGGFRSTTIVLVMAGSWLIVGLVEWLVGRESAFVPRPRPAAPSLLPGWPADDGSPDDGLTIVAELEPSKRR